MRTFSRSEVELRSSGPGLPAYLGVVVRDFDPDRLNLKQLEGQVGKAEEVAQWLFDHITVACSEAIMRKLTTLLGRS